MVVNKSLSAVKSFWSVSESHLIIKSRPLFGTRSAIYRCAFWLENPTHWALACKVKLNYKSRKFKLMATIKCFFILLSCFFSISNGRVPPAEFPVKAVNLGGWLVTEGWIKPSLFDGIHNKDLLVYTYEVVSYYFCLPFVYVDWSCSPHT